MIVSELRLKPGRSAPSHSTTVEAAPITIFVGPNNSGKSKALSEIRMVFTHASTHVSTNQIVDSIVFRAFSPEDAQSEFCHLKPHATVSQSSVFRTSPTPNHIPLTQYTLQRNGRYKTTVFTEDYFQNSLVKGPGHDSMYLQWANIYTSFLGGFDRLQLTNTQEAGDLKAAPQTSLQVLFKDDRRREALRAIIYEAFEKYLVIDPTNVGKLQVRLSDQPPLTASLERSLDSNAVAFHKAAEPIGSFSDGVRAFTGILIEALAEEPKILILDEPEAFLHPSLAQKLGYELARLSSINKSNAFVATHSSAFVMGCLHANTPVTVVRLTYQNAQATCRSLPSSSLLSLMRNPLLRSVNAINALFYENVVITEADTDRAFYQEINERLLRHQPGKGVKNCSFMNAQNKQTIYMIMGPLRELGIPAAGVVDLDVLKEGCKVWSNLLTAANVPTLEHESLNDVRRRLKDSFESRNLDMKRCGGVSQLSGQEREAADNLIARLAQYGLFVVPFGEVECWLKAFDVSGHGPEWLVKMFEQMGSNPESETYCRPSNGDVWDFVATVRAWLVNSSRNGIPD